MTIAKVATSAVLLLALSLSLGCSRTTTVQPGADLPLPTSSVVVEPKATGDSRAGAKSIASKPLPLTDQGAGDFTAYWFELLNDAYQTGDASAVEVLSEPVCTACRDYLNRHRDAMADTFSRASSSQPVTAPFGTPFKVDVLTATGAATGVAVVTFGYQVEGADEGQARAAVRWNQGHWVMGEIGR